MGIFDSYLSDLQKEVVRVTDGVAKIQNNTKSIKDNIVSAIDGLEEKVNNLPSEVRVKKQFKKSLKPTSSRRGKEKIVQPAKRIN
jgi:hypothetical protein